MNSFSFTPPPLDSRPLWRHESSDPQRSLSRGGLLVEAVITLALLAVFLGFIFQKQLQQQKQLDEVNTAEAIKVVSDSLKNYLAANAASHSPGSVTTLATPRTDFNSAFIDTAFAAFLPAGFSFDKFSAFVRNDAGKLSALVVTDTEDFKGRPYSGTSAARIAALIGSQGGLLKGTDTKAAGNMGLWDMDVSSFSVSPTADLEQVRIVAAVDFDQDRVEELAADIDDLRGKVLFRVPMPSIPNANVMETDLTFENGATKTLKIGNDGSLTGANFSVAANGNITAKAITATTGAFSGSLKAASGDFGSGTLKSGAISATSGTFSGTVSGAAGSFSGSLAGHVRSVKNASVGQSCSGGEIAYNGSDTLLCLEGKFAKAGSSGSSSGGSGSTQTCQCTENYAHQSTYNQCVNRYGWALPSVTSNNCPLAAAYLEGCPSYTMCPSDAGWTRVISVDNRTLGVHGEISGGSITYTYQKN